MGFDYLDKPIRFNLILELLEKLDIFGKCVYLGKFLSKYRIEKQKMPLLEFEEPSLSQTSEWLLANSETIRKYFEEHKELCFTSGDLNQLVMEALESLPYTEDYLILMINLAQYTNRLLSRRPVRQAIAAGAGGDKRTFFFVTFTSDPEKSEDDNILDITRYRQSHFKKYKYTWVGEKDSAESGKYHQHVLIECPKKVVHTQQNLKPAGYYKGNINVQKVTPTKASINNIITYMKKEGQIPKGDIEYFLNLDI